MSRVDLKRDSEKRLKSKISRKLRRDSKLQELEQQLQFAESRCGTLKQQLHYIKLLYGSGKSGKSAQPSIEEGHGDGSNVNCDNMPAWNNQNENFGSKEGGDGPVLMKQAPSQSNTLSTHSSNKQTSVKSDREKSEEPKPKGHSKKRNHLKLLKIKKKNSKKTKKRLKLDDASSSKFSNVSSQTQSQVWQDPLVEIYKNSSLNVESESGLEIVYNNKRIKPNEMFDVKNQKLGHKNCESRECDDVQEKLTDSKAKSCNSFNGKKGGNALKEEGMQTDLSLDVNHLLQAKLKEFLDKENSIKTENCYLEPAKNYCQPTISSKRKQVGRDIYSNINNINIRNIPFIAARSTAPSHNIGVNIQQVLSIIKKRNPLNENLTNSIETSAQENQLLVLLNSKKFGNKTNEFEPPREVATAGTDTSESKRRPEVIRSSLSHWKSDSDCSKEKNSKPKLGDETQDWNAKVNKLKKVLVFLHQDFTTLSQKYKRLQKKLTKRNITKTDAKGELADIERDLEKKEEEITVVIGLYKEVLSLREDYKKLQDKYNLVVSGKTLILGGLKQSNSTHTQMTSLLRKIQNFQDQLKG